MNIIIMNYLMACLNAFMSLVTQKKKKEKQQKHQTHNDIN